MAAAIECRPLPGLRCPESQIVEAQSDHGLCHAGGYRVLHILRSQGRPAPVPHVHLTTEPARALRSHGSDRL